MERNVILFSFPLVAVYFKFPHFLTKAAVIWILALACFVKKTSYAKAIAIGLVFSSFGDIFLELEDDYKYDLFVPGLVSFLIAHIIYIFAFKQAVTSEGKYAVPVALGYYGYVMFKLVPKVEEILRIPVLVYGLAICNMAFFSINRYFALAADQRESGRYALLGSLSFVASDTILAFNKFYNPIENAKRLVMVTYYAGQILIAASAVYQSTTEKKSK
jgi:uncharacterized membrane protein YhhN